MYLFQKNNKKTQSTYTSLMQIAGVGHKMATQTCERLGISKHVMLRDLSVNQLHQLNQTIHQYLLVDMEYHSFISRKIKSLINISSYRGIRHLQGLPCRGQRTHTNAKTSRKGRYNNFDKKHKLNKR